MKLAKEMPLLLTSKGHTSDLLGLSQAIALLSATEEVKTDVIEKIESGEKVTIAEINRMKKEVADNCSRTSQNFLVGCIDYFFKVMRCQERNLSSRC